MNVSWRVPDSEKFGLAGLEGEERKKPAELERGKPVQETELPSRKMAQRSCAKSPAIAALTAPARRRSAGQIGGIIVEVAGERQRIGS